jgi:hypothetical protein
MPGSLSKKVNYEFHPDGYVIAAAAAGIDLELADSLQLFEAARSRYGRPFGLICNRINDYTIDLAVYEYIEGAEDIVAMAVVLYENHGFPAARMEARYLRQTAYATFFDIDSAERWMRERLAEGGQPPGA